MLCCVIKISILIGHLKNGYIESKVVSLFLVDYFLFLCQKQDVHSYLRSLHQFSRHLHTDYVISIHFFCYLTCHNNNNNITRKAVHEKSLLLWFQLVYCSHHYPPTLRHTKERHMQYKFRFSFDCCLLSQWWRQ